MKEAGEIAKLVAVYVLLIVVPLGLVAAVLSFWLPVTIDRGGWRAVLADASTRALVPIRAGPSSARCRCRGGSGGAPRTGLWTAPLGCDSRRRVDCTP